MQSKRSLRCTVLHGNVTAFEACLCLDREAVATQNMIHGFADWNFDSVAFHELTKGIVRMGTYLARLLHLNAHVCEIISGHCLTWLAKHSFESFDLFSKYDIHESELENFVLAIETSHSAHPYHNVLRYFVRHPYLLAFIR